MYENIFEASKPSVPAIFDIECFELCPPRMDSPLVNGEREKVFKIRSEVKNFGWK